jgi:shikimate 5-dehydrogenase
MVYDPLETRLLREAKAAGCPIVGGLEMLLAQAVAQFETWTGLEAPVQVMKSAALLLAQEGQ